MAVAAILVSAIFSSCSGDKADVSELLATVPADASAVVAVNMKNLVEKSGSKIDGSKILPGTELEAFISAKDEDEDINELREILNGESGIDPTVALVFLEGPDLYFTGFLANPDDFKIFTKKRFEGEFSESNGVSSLGNVALKGNQFWIHANHRNAIDTDQITRFISLSDKLSFLSNGYAEKISTFTNDIEGWANISSLYSASGMSFQQKAMAGMGLAILFSDAQDIAFHADFANGSLSTSLSVLNSKGSPAKFNLPTDRIDVGMVKGLGDSAEYIFAMAVSPKLIDQLRKDLGDKNIPGLNEFAKAFSALDGTCIVEGSGENVKGVCSTKGEDSAALADLISQALQVTVNKDGKLLRFEKGEVSGTILNAEVAARFKGSMVAFISSSEKVAGVEFKGFPVKDIFSALIPADGSMQMEVVVSSDAPKENFLLTWIKSKI